MVLLFDFDNTIIKTDKAKIQKGNETEDLRIKYAYEKDENKKEEILADLKKQYCKFEPATSVISCIRRCKKQGVKMGVLTTSPRAYVESTLSFFGLKEVFDFIVCHDDVKKMTGQSEDEPNKVNHIRFAMDTYLKDYDMKKDGPLYLIGDGMSSDMMAVKYWNNTSEKQIKGILASWFTKNSKDDEWEDLLKHDKEEVSGRPYLICCEQNSFVSFVKRELDEPRFRIRESEEETTAELDGETIFVNERFYYLYDYHKLSGGKSKNDDSSQSGGKGKNDVLSQSFFDTFKVDKKEDDKTLIKQFKKAFAAMHFKPEETALFIIPSHSIGNWNKKLEKFIADMEEDGYVSAFTSVYRFENTEPTKKLKKRSESSVTRDNFKTTVKFRENDSINWDKIKNIVILDDVITTGNSMLACKELIEEKLGTSKSIYMIGVVSTVYNSKKNEDEFTGDHFYIMEKIVGPVDYEALQTRIIVDDDPLFSKYRSMHFYEKAPKKISKEIYSLQWITDEKGIIDGEDEINRFETFSEAKSAYDESRQKECDYVVLRGKDGQRVIKDKWCRIPKKYGKESVVIKCANNDEAESFLDKWQRGEGLASGEVDARIHLMPTLFRMKKLDDNELPGEDEELSVPLDRIYDAEVLKKHMKIGAKFNAMLPKHGEDSKHVYFDYGINGKKKISFGVDQNYVDRMLVMELTDIHKGMVDVSNAFAVVRLKAKKRDVRGCIDFKLNSEKYKNLTDEDCKDKPLLLMDELLGDIVLEFSCKVESIPFPGKDEGLFAFVDGSSTKENGGDEEKYGAGYLLCEDGLMRIGYAEGGSEKANFLGEIEAAEYILKNYDGNVTDEKTLRIFFDNTSVGYIPAEIFDKAAKKSSDENKDSKNYSKDYSEKVNDFLENNPKMNLEFIHVDGHFSILGNEIADRLAQVNGEKLKDTKEFEPDFVDKMKKPTCKSQKMISEKLKYLKTRDEEK